jgi:hypothetical protein
VAGVGMEHAGWRAALGVAWRGLGCWWGPRLQGAWVLVGGGRGGGGAGDGGGGLGAWWLAWGWR